MNPDKNKNILVRFERFEVENKDVKNHFHFVTKLKTKCFVTTI